MNEQSVVLDIDRLTVRYNGNVALEDVSFCVHSGEMVAIIGPNGAGKSTLMGAIMGNLQASSGQVHIGGRGRARLGYVPQHNAVDWSFPVTVADVVMMGRVRQIGWLRWPRRADKEAVQRALQLVGMSGYARRSVGALSGGQRRRVFIARALAQDTDTLLLDEPFAGVDVGAQAEMMAVLDDLNRQGITILLSTHDLNLAFNRFDTVLALRRRLIAYGEPQEVYTRQTLRALYGGRFTVLEDIGAVELFVDDPGCAHGC